ncbi:MAG: hypothetical protein NC084_11200 [Bacteroides sp.]|nr:hypothetical protein [Eubacterium sp.]MCM1419492.1 hypothetical protein [Roseburia sp.]MCM1463257.1 hypothetical protein [Bacteroides sp.]
MPGECFVIALIIGGLSLSFFRANRKNWGFAVLPLAIVPFVVGTVMYVVTTFTKIEYSFLLPMGLIIGSLTVSCIWIGIGCAVLMKSPKRRVSYLVISVGFSLALSFILMIRYYAELVPPPA